jgi:DNA polymerase-3 subunit delta
MARTLPKKESAGIRLSDFLKESGQAKPIYVLRGSDPYLMDQGRRHVRALAIGDADPGMALIELAGPEAGLADVLDALRTPPLVSPRRLVIIREAADFVDDNRETLQKYLAAPSPVGTLCLEVAGGWNKNTNLAERILEIGAVVLCEIRDPGVLPRWLQGEAKRRHGKAITYAAVQMLIEYLGADFASLLSALDMLALYIGPGQQTIDAPDVDALIARGHHERVWELCDAVAARRIPRALELLDAFWTEGMVAPQIVGLMRPTFRQLVRAKALSRRMSLDAAMDKAAVPYPARDRVRRSLSAFTDAHLADAYQALVDADLEAKSTPNDRLAMETLIHRLCRPEAARAKGSAK